ncbi:glycosyltransferase family 2 protein [Sphingomonas sp. HDW15A]|uniref:glycosyltransferase family 2 protein n=1 Tax=Sphingomonas sp. HDW15A TaxID=2714942 RepID=UPI00140E2A0E|nr:glycosyltransferase family 2 protein [Sphingomonas sp. HDW15A]QIK95837.1 glycosyltransferase family 2 protein [Sphingomonas sp. HDW15A]
MKNASFTIVICTWNRAESLRRTLDSLSSMTVPQDLNWSIFVVDNGSSDSTQDVIACFAEKLPIRTVVERSPGLSNARNTALEHVNSDYVIWTDDDVIVDRAFLQAYVAAAREYWDTDLFGGAILPCFEGGAPRWLERGVGDVPAIAAMHVVKDPAQIGPTIVAGRRETYPYGANMMFRRSSLRNLRFDPSLGRIGNDLLHGEETEIMDRVLDASSSEGRFVPGAIVHHCIPRDRQTLAFVRDHAVGTGRTAVKRGNPDGSGLGVMGIPFWLIASRVRNAVKAQLKRFSGRPDWLDNYIDGAANAGAMRELLARRQSSKG